MPTAGYLVASSQGTLCVQVNLGANSHYFGGGVLRCLLCLPIIFSIQKCGLHEELPIPVVYTLGKAVVSFTDIIRFSFYITQVVLLINSVSYCLSLNLKSL